MTNQDPIADREAKIAAWLGNATSQTLDNWHDGPHPIAYVLDPCEIDEGVALMRSAPDGDAKLRELRELVVKMPLGAFQGTARMRLVDEIDRLLSKPSEPAPSTTKTFKVTQTGEHFCETQCEERKRLKGELSDIRAIDGPLMAKDSEIHDLQSENARLQADLAAARADQAAMARRELDRLLFRYDHGDLGFGPTEPQDLLTDIRQRLAALPAQQPEPKPDAATAYEGDPKDCAFRGPIWPAWKTVDSAPHHKAVLAAEPGCGMAVAKLWDDGTWRGDMGDHFRPTHWVELPDWPSEFPQSRGEPKPDAATRDGDEVLREYLTDYVKPEIRSESFTPGCLDEALAELCRRELARGGK